MKILSQASNYGIRALTYIVSQKRDGYISIGQISEELDISFHFLTKTFQLLSRHGLITSYRGPSGGVALNRPPEEIFLIEVIEILEGKDFFDTCLLGLPGCGEAEPCPVHDFWKIHKEKMKREFSNTTLADLGTRVNIGKMRIKE